MTMLGAGAVLVAVVMSVAAQELPQVAPPKKVTVAAAVTVPMIAMNGLPIVDVTINGQGPFKFGIETGAGFSVITQKTADALKLSAIRGSGEEAVFKLDRVAIGAAAFDEVEVVRTNAFAQNAIDGVLGLPFYQDLLVTLDYPGKTVRFERGELPAANGQDVLAIMHVGPFWGLPMTIGGASFNAVLDTRSTGGISLTPESAAAVTFDGPLRVTGRSRGVAIEEVEVKSGMLASNVKIGRYEFPKPTVTVRPLPPGFPTAPLVGARVLNNFVVTLDQKNARLRLAKTGATTIDLNAVPAPPAPPSAQATAPAGGRGGQVALQDYVGEYGERVISIVNGALSLNRAGRGALTMVSTGTDAFGLQGIPAAKIEFVREQGKVVAMKVLTPDGWETARRTK